MDILPEALSTDILNVGPVSAPESASSDELPVVKSILDLIRDAKSLTRSAGGYLVSSARTSNRPSCTVTVYIE